MVEVKTHAENVSYRKIDGGFKEYDRTFGINSIKELTRWYALHPTQRGAILDIAGYGVAPSTLANKIYEKHIVKERPYGIALANELSPHVQAPYADCVQGDMGDFVFREDGGKTLQLLKGKLSQNEAPQGAALITMRPVGGYTAFERRNNVLLMTRAGYETVYATMFGVIAEELLAPDGVFVVEIPPLVKDRASFQHEVESRLGEKYYVSPPRTARWVQSISPPGDNLRFHTLTIRK